MLTGFILFSIEDTTVPAVSPWYCNSYTESFTWIWTLQLLSATSPIEHCAVSLRPSSIYLTKTDQQCGYCIDRKSSSKYPQLKLHAPCDILIVQVMYKLWNRSVQCHVQNACQLSQPWPFLYCGVHSCTGVVSFKHAHIILVDTAFQILK